MYTIHYERDGTLAKLPIWFGEKQAAIASACELLKSGFRVSRVDGPGFRMEAPALDAYRRSASARGGRRLAAQLPRRD